MTTYKDLGTSIQRLSDGASIPKADGNRDYVEYLQWLAGGGIVTPADVPTIAQLTATALSEVRALRAALFPTLAGMQSEALARGNQIGAMDIANIQQGIRDITATDLTGAVTKAEIELKFKNAWLAILATAPAPVVAAFNGLRK